MRRKLIEVALPAAERVGVALASVLSKRPS